MSILNDRQIQQKITRLAYEIIEQNTDSKVIYLAGINNNGYRFAEVLKASLDHLELCPFKTELIRVRLKPADPISEEVSLDIDRSKLSNKTIILVDDVANTGRTLFYAIKPFLNFLIKKMQVAVLVDRKHKSFPIQVDYLGLSLATTMKEHIDVQLTKSGKFQVQFS